MEVAHDRLDALRTAAGDRDSRLSLLRHQVNELSALALKPGEVAAVMRSTSAWLMAENSWKRPSPPSTPYMKPKKFAHQRVSRALAMLDGLSELEPQVRGHLPRLADAQAQLADAAEGLRGYLAIWIWTPSASSGWRAGSLPSTTWRASTMWNRRPCRIASRPEDRAARPWRIQHRAPGSGSGAEAPANLLPESRR